MIKPLNNNVLIKLIEVETTTKKGLIIQNNQSSEIKTGEIIRVSDNSNSFKEKNKVIFNINESNKVFYNNQNFILIENNKILGIIEGEL